MASSKTNSQRTAPSMETPRNAGFRQGMSATGLIARKLARVYDVAGDLPSDMGAALHRLEAKDLRNR